MKHVAGVGLPLILLTIVTILYADRIDLPFWAICVIFVALVIAGLAIALYRARLRTVAMAAAARGLGLEFSEAFRWGHSFLFRSASHGRRR